MLFFLENVKPKTTSSLIAEVLSALDGKLANLNEFTYRNMYKN